MKSLKPILLVLLLNLLLVANAFSELRMPRIFSSNMVLQQGIEIPVWGWADRSERISIVFMGETYKTKANKEGKWMVKLPSQQYGGPYFMAISGKKNKLRFDNVMIGEVWICSGQSNMEMPVELCNNPVREIPAAVYPDIRFFTVPRVTSKYPMNDIKSGQWEECTPETVKGFTGVGYFFGRELHQELNVPIGLIHTSWGGTIAETWMSTETIEKDIDLKHPLKELQETDLSDYAELQRKKYMDNITQIFHGELPTKDKGLVNEEAVWAAQDFDDSNWAGIDISSLWEGQGYGGIDGIAWYRKEIFLSEEQVKNDIVLYLGKVDDNDITWFNGIEIGRTKHQDSWKADRVYQIEAKLLKAGKNTLTVRVQDMRSGGGIYGNPEDQYLLVGGKKIEIAGDWRFKLSEVYIHEPNFNLSPNSYPTLLFNSMLKPLIPYGIKGAIWYQGESNAGRGKQYKRVFGNLIRDWRMHWQQGDFPFLFVSLANYMEPDSRPRESEWAELRESQTKTLALPNTGMAISIDIGDSNDIHPKNKQDVGKRLALNAFKISYGKNMVHSGPMYESVEFREGKAYITFSNVGSGLMVNDKYGYLKCFTIAGADKEFHWAKAEIISKDKIVVYSSQMKNPVAVRFAWANNPLDFNLFNKEGLPAIPFRTDTWPGITK